MRLIGILAHIFGRKRERNEQTKRNEIWIEMRYIKQKMHLLYLLLFVCFKMIFFTFVSVHFDYDDILRKKSLVQIMYTLYHHRGCRALKMTAAASGLRRVCILFFFF